MIRYWQDFAVGDEIVAGEASLDRDAMIAFAREWDPQPMHLSEEGGKDTLFGGFVGSGWHALSLTMRLMVEARPFGDAPLIGIELDKIRLRRPLKPGMRLGVRARVLETRAAGKPERGYVRLEVATLVRPEDEVLITQEWTMVVPGR